MAVVRSAVLFGAVATLPLPLSVGILGGSGSVGFLADSYWAGRMSNALADDRAEVVRLRDLSSTQWKSGIAAWLGWFFDGLDMHLYTLVATPFVAQLLLVDVRDDAVR